MVCLIMIILIWVFPDKGKLFFVGGSGLLSSWHPNVNFIKGR